MKNTILALTVLVLIVAVEPIADIILTAIDYWQLSLCVLIPGIGWIAYLQVSAHERRMNGRFD